MKKVLCWLAIFVMIASAGLAQQEKAPAPEEKAEEQVWDVRELKDPENEKRSIGYELTPAQNPESEDRERQKQREDSYEEAKKERRAKVRRLRGEQ